jgi:hypothetical protein
MLGALKNPRDIRGVLPRLQAQLDCGEKGQARQVATPVIPRVVVPHPVRSERSPCCCSPHEVIIILLIIPTFLSCPRTRMSKPAPNLSSSPPPLSLPLPKYIRGLSG